MSEKIVTLNEKVILKELVRRSAKKTPNELLGQEAEKLAQAARDERNECLCGGLIGLLSRTLLIFCA